MAGQVAVQFPGVAELSVESRFLRVMRDLSVVALRPEHCLFELANRGQCVPQCGGGGGQQAVRLGRAIIRGEVVEIAQQPCVLRFLSAIVPRRRATGSRSGWFIHCFIQGQANFAFTPANGARPNK
jgi:hypothetical protein